MEQCAIYCEGPILTAIQQSGIFQDGKTFVDMPLKADPAEVLAAFKALNGTSKAELQAFLDQYFLPAGSDLEDWHPNDWNPSPPFLDKLDATYKQFGKDLNDMWYVLGKKAAADVAKNPQRHSLLPIPYPFIVPGGRFREFYYWDSFWIVRGLLGVL